MGIKVIVERIIIIMSIQAGLFLDLPLGYSQDMIIGKYSRITGNHGSSAMYIFEESNNLIYIKKVLSRPSEERCLGRYHLDQDTLRITYEDSHTTAESYYEVKEEQDDIVSPDSAIIHLRAFYNQISNLDKLNLNSNTLVKYDTFKPNLTDRLHVVILDSNRNKLADIYTFSSTLILECSSQSILQISSYNSYPIELILENHQGKEVFFDAHLFEKYILNCTSKKKEFLIIRKSDKELRLKDLDSKKSFTLIKG